MDGTCDCGSHSREVLSQWQRFTLSVSAKGDEAAIDGCSLDMATVVAIARSVNSDEVASVY